MPNWCDNTVYITHDDPKKIQILVDAWKANKFFGTIYPEPDYNKVKVKPMLIMLPICCQFKIVANVN